MFLSRVLTKYRPVLKDKTFSKDSTTVQRCLSVASYPLSIQKRSYSGPPNREKTKDLYALMGVTPNATQQQIKEAYYKLSMKYHPDKNKNSKEAHTMFTELTEAYSVLGSHDLRRKYDKGLLHQYPHRHGPTHATHSTHRDTASTMHGRKVKFDFDEFYQAHYGEALKREQEARRSQAAAKERAKLYTISQTIQQTLIVSVVLSVLVVGWYGYHRRDQDLTSTKNYPIDKA